MKLPSFPGLEVTLSVGGQDLEEYNDAEGEDTGGIPWKGMKYVEAASGANFSIELRMDRRFAYKMNQLEMTIYLDGVWAVGKVFYPSKVGEQPPITVSGKQAYEDGMWTFRKFEFADLETNDTQARADLKEKLARIGEVSVNLCRVRNVGTTMPESARFQDATGSKGVPEKALKGRAISSRATLGQAEITAPATFARVEYPWGTGPFANFKFQYRSRRDLQIEGIIPRDPTPVPLEERDPETLTAEEARELVRIQRQQLQERTQVKREKRERDEEDGEEYGGVSVVSEQRKRQRVSTDSGVEVIDLSNEDDDDDD